MKWIDKEKGPLCFCGKPTFVSVQPNGEADLVCILHDPHAGALFPLPRDKRPINWPNLSNGEVDALMLLGQDEYDVRDHTEDDKGRDFILHEEDESGKPPRTLN